MQFVFSRQIRGRAKRSEVKRVVGGGADGRAHTGHKQGVGDWLGIGDKR